MTFELVGWRQVDGDRHYHAGISEAFAAEVSRRGDWR